MNSEDGTLLQHMYLIGFMGAGKTTVACELAQQLDVPWVDIDAMVEEQAGCSIAQIFERDGEAAFRTLESRCLQQVAEGPAQIVSCGGGIVKTPGNVELMRASGKVVHLAVTAEAAVARIPDASTRPLFRDLQTARTTIEQRAPLYIAAAHATVETSGRSLSEIVADVRELVEIS